MNTDQLLSKSKVEVAAGTYALVSLSTKEWQRLIADPELSPRMTVPFMIFYDGREVTLLLDEADFEKMRHAVDGARTGRGYRLLTFDIELEPTVVGFMARIAGIMADAGVSIIALSSFSRDHLLIKQHDLPEALMALRGHVAEVC